MVDCPISYVRASGLAAAARFGASEEESHKHQETDRIESATSKVTLESKGKCAESKLIAMGMIFVAGVLGSDRRVSSSALAAE